MINSSLCVALEVIFFSVTPCVVMQWKEAKLLQIRKCLESGTHYILVVMSCSQIDMSVFDAIVLCQRHTDNCQRNEELV